MVRNRSSSYLPSPNIHLQRAIFSAICRCTSSLDPEISLSIVVHNGGKTRTSVPETSTAVAILAVTLLWQRISCCFSSPLEKERISTPPMTKNPRIVITVATKKLMSPFLLIMIRHTISDRQPHIGEEVYPDYPQ